MSNDGINAEACKPIKEILMQWFKNLFLRPSGAPKSPRRAPRPGLERLDDRLVPSVTATSAVTTGTTHSLFAIDQTTQQVTGFATVSGYNAPAGYRVFWNPQGEKFTQVSASVDPKTGWAEVYALGTDHSLWRMDSGTVWHNLGGSYKRISATHDGQCFAVTSDGSDVRLFNQADQPTDLGAPGGYASDLAAGRSAFYGQDDVFAIGPDGGIWAWNGDYPIYGVGAYRAWREIATGSFGTLSATQNGTVFALDSFGNLFKESESLAYIGNGLYYLFWNQSNISGGNTYTQISADVDAHGYAEVYAIGTDAFHTLNLFDQGPRQVIAWFATEVSAADSGYVFAVNTSGSAFGYDPQLATWINLGGNVK
jgi:hypothetical protein